MADDELTVVKSEPLPALSVVKSEPLADTKSSALVMAKDVGIGVLKGAAHTVLDAGNLMRRVPVGVMTGKPGETIGSAVDALYGQPGLSGKAFPAAQEATAYANTPQRVGGALETLGEMAVPVRGVATALPSAAHAGATFQGVMGAAKDVPLDVSKVGDVALDIAKKAQEGGGTQWGPPPVRQLIQYLTDPKKPDMTYEVGRNFASNISRLSAKDWASIPPAMNRDIQELRMALNAANGRAAAVAGKGAEYLEAMNEYAKAMKLRDVFSTAGSAAMKALPYATVGGLVTGGSYWLLNQIKKAIGE